MLSVQLYYICFLDTLSISGAQYQSAKPETTSDQGNNKALLLAHELLADAKLVCISFSQNLRKSTLTKRCSTGFVFTCGFAQNKFSKVPR